MLLLVFYESHLYNVHTKTHQGYIMPSTGMDVVEQHLVDLQAGVVLRSVAETTSAILAPALRTLVSSRSGFLPIRNRPIGTIVDGVSRLHPGWRGDISGEERLAELDEEWVEEFGDALTGHEIEISGAYSRLHSPSSPYPRTIGQVPVAQIALCGKGDGPHANQYRVARLDNDSTGAQAVVVSSSLADGGSILVQGVTDERNIRPYHTTHEISGTDRQLARGLPFNLQPGQAVISNLIALARDPSGGSVDFVQTAQIQAARAA